MKKLFHIFFALVFLCSSLAEGETISDSSSSKEDYFPTLIYVPNVGEHAFTTNSYLGDPFISNALKLNLGYTNSMSSKIPLDFDIDYLDSLGISDSLYVKVKLMHLTGSVLYRHKINDWSALALKFQGVGRMGSSTYSLLFQGISSITGFEANWLFNIFSGKNSMLTASFGMNNQSYTYINIVDFVKSAADTSRIKPLSLSQTYDALYSSFGLSFAHGFTDFFGIIATGNLGYGELPTNGFKHDYFWDLGVYLDFHLDQPIGWPIGLGIGTKLNSYPIELDDPRDVSRSVFLKLAYNAKRDFIIGIETFYLNIPTNYYDLTFQFYKAQFNIQLYF